MSPGEILARWFHEVYERLAPSFGYETRTETRQFDRNTPNGRLMIAVCSELSESMSSRTTPPQAAGGEPVAWVDPMELGMIRKFGGMIVATHEAEPKSFRTQALYDHPPAIWQEWEKVVRAWRNRFISERTGYYQAQGQCYEEAIASAEYDANCYADGLVKAGIAASPAQPAGGGAE